MKDSCTSLTTWRSRSFWISRSTKQHSFSLRRWFGRTQGRERRLKKGMCIPSCNQRIISWLANFFHSWILCPRRAGDQAWRSGLFMCRVLWVIRKGPCSKTIGISWTSCKACENLKTVYDLIQKATVSRRAFSSLPVEQTPQAATIDLRCEGPGLRHLLRGTFLSGGNWTTRRPPNLVYFHNKLAVLFWQVTGLF